tara:strand:- start:3114 stop:4580 length:1467 start_codon:yes stop_codon:yes gene_type:complete
MSSSLFNLGLKKFLRAPQLEAKLAIKVLMGLLFLYFAGSFLFGGIVIYPALSKKFPEQDAISIINSTLALIFIFELIIRYFLQQLPVTEIKSLLMLSIPKNRIIRNVLLRSIISIYNAIPYLFYLPISIALFKDDYLLSQAFTWWVSLMLLSLSINFITILVNKNNKILVGFILGLILLFVAENYLKIEIISLAGLFFDSLLVKPIMALIPLSIFLGLYSVTFRFLKNNLNLEGSLAAKKEVANAERYDFLDIFGSHALFLKNDLRLIVRNLRPRNVVMASFLFLFYGLAFFPTLEHQPEFFIPFASIFITGGFLLTYGNYVPAWDSEYYPFLMCQNLSYKRYLDSKWYLMTFAVVVSTIFSIPYVYFGVDVYLMILSGAFFNIGLGTWITLYGGLLNKQSLQLNVKANAFENTQAFSGKQFLMILPKMILPVLLYLIPAKISNSTLGLITLASTGILGIVFKNQILNQMVRLYVKEKHQTLKAFTQK